LGVGIVITPRSFGTVPQYCGSSKIGIVYWFFRRNWWCGVRLLGVGLLVVNYLVFCFCSNVFHITEQKDVLFRMRTSFSKEEGDTSGKEDESSVHSHGFRGWGQIFHSFSLIRG
jgi:hypothetical protein